MRLCIMHEYFKPDITGGADIFLSKLADYLLTKDFEIEVIATLQKEKKEMEMIDGIKINRFRTSPFKFTYMQQFPGLTIPWNYFNRRLISKMKKIIRNADVVYLNNIFHLSFSPLRILSFIKKPIVFDFHDYWFLCPKKDLLFNEGLCKKISSVRCSKCLSDMIPGMTILAPFVWPFISLERKLKDKLFIADVIIVHSNFVKKNVENFVKKPVKVIPYPYFGKINKVERKLGKKVKLLFIGRIVRQKGVNMIPNIARELKKCGIDYEINVLGDGPLLQKLKDNSKNINVNYHGAIYDEKIKENFFSNSDILLVPSLWDEPFGIVVLEAMANGLPVIASNKGGLEEIVKNNEIGMTCEPTVKDVVESIKKLISNENFYKKLSMNCYKKIKNYSPEVIFEEYRKLFENLHNS